MFPLCRVASAVGAFDISQSHVLTGEYKYYEAPIVRVFVLLWVHNEDDRLLHREATGKMG